ncbi:MAG: RNA 2',3'-cyclic phosphodiesterase [Pseudomonadales bacterium]|nr:RNA 2',3'-cyclic phosphodiesterase [Pseudomonadales bacterium]
MRLFFGLKPAPHEALEIADWRSKSLPPLDHPVPAANLHITLTFLGEVPERSLEVLVDEAGGIRNAPLRLTLDELGYWPRPRILWIGPRSVPQTATTLARATASAARRAGLRPEKRDWTPHVTLARRCRLAPPAGAIAPAFKISFEAFCLFESVRTRAGQRYDVVAEFPLTA